MKRKKNQTGQLLIEVLIAFTVIVLAVVGLVSATVSSISSTDFAKRQSYMTSQTQEAIEAIRNDYYSQNWSDFQANCESIGNLKLTDLPSDYTAAVGCTNEGAGLAVIVTVSWTKGSQTHESVLEDFFAPK